MTHTLFKAGWTWGPRSMSGYLQEPITRVTSISSSCSFTFSWLHSFSPTFDCEMLSIVVYLSPFPPLPTILPRPSPAPYYPKSEPERCAGASRPPRVVHNSVAPEWILHLHYTKNSMQIIRDLIKYVLDKIFPQSCLVKKIAAMTEKEQKKPSSPSNLVRVGSGLVNKLALLNPVTGESDEPILVGFEDVSAAAYRIRKGIKKTPCEVNICRKLAIIAKCCEGEFVTSEAFAGSSYLRPGNKHYNLPA